ncbi:MAG TPA: hypothetical protein VME20_10465 [Acidimicrobiales bacterium]|nr:hypothetical protein [Acidimicrobiales bacterium]
MPEPLTALRGARAVTAEVAVIETVAVRVLAQHEASLLAAFAGNELGGADFGNWFAPTRAGLEDLCRGAGFKAVEVRRGAPAMKPWGTICAATLAAPWCSTELTSWHEFDRAGPPASATTGNRPDDGHKGNAWVTPRLTSAHLLQLSREKTRVS